jgi:hypothetical protein
LTTRAMAVKATIAPHISSHEQPLLRQGSCLQIGPPASKPVSKPSRIISTLSRHYPIQPSLGLSRPSSATPASSTSPTPTTRPPPPHSTLLRGQRAWGPSRTRSTLIGRTGNHPPPLRMGAAVALDFAHGNSMASCRTISAVIWRR